MSAYSIALVNAHGDTEDIRAMWTQYLETGNAELMAAKLQLVYVSNPTEPGVLYQLSEEGDTVPVGTIGLCPRKFYYKDQKCIAATLSDFVVENAHRSAGPALMLMRSALKTGTQRFALVYGIPNSHSRAICKRAGMSRFATSVRYSLVLSSESKLANHVNRLLLPLAVSLVDCALRLQRFWKRLSSGSNLRCREATFDDAAIDEIWNGRQSGLLVSDRTSQMLQWRYDWQTSKHWQLAIAQNSNGENCGYIVWRMREGVALIGDFFSKEPASQTTPLLNAFLQVARKAGAHTIIANYFGPVAVANSFSRAGFFRAATPGDTLYVANESSIDDAQLAQWYFTDFDNDD